MTILLLDISPLICEMITMIILRFQPDAKVASANTLREFSRLLSKYNNPNFIILDLQTTEHLNIIDADQISVMFPMSKIILLSTPQFNLDVQTHFKMNKHTIISKTESINEISKKLRDIINPTIPENKKPLIKLSKRHKQLIQMLNLGYTNIEIAQQLGIAENTVKVHFFRLYNILGVSSRLQALNFAKNNGFI